MPSKSLLRHVEACNRVDPARFVPFTIAGDPIGAVRKETARHLTRNGLAKANGKSVGISGGGFLAVSKRLAKIAESLAEAGLMAALRGEMTPVLRRWGAGAIAEIDRAGLPGLGLPAYGVHVNGFVRGKSELCLWVGHRAKDRQVAPGKLDHLIAGGLPMGYTAMETVIKEGEEEAGLSEETCSQAKPVGLISYRLEMPEGLRNDILFVYDLELPRGVVPVNFDGEVERFELCSIPKVIGILRDTDDFKFNVNLVVIDFLIRHGFLDPDGEPDFAALVKGLRR